MLRLTLNPEPKWLTLPAGVRIKVRPCTTALFAAATSGKDVTDLGPEVSHDHRWAVINSAIAALAVMEWEGVADSDGTEMPASPEAVLALMDMILINQAFSAQYITPYLLMVQEKKELPPSPNGLSEAGRSTAGDAQASA